MRRKPNRSAIYGQAYVTHHRTPSWTTPRKVIPAAAFRKTANGIQMTAYNGIIQIEVNHLANLMEVNRVKQEAEELSQTYLAFMGSSGHSVKIWVRFTRPDKSLPQNREEAEIFQAHAYRKAVSLYQPILSYSIELKNPALEQFCRQTYDPELYYNPDSTIMYMRQPMEMPSETTYQEAVQAETSPFKRLIPGYDSLETLSALFEVALNKACQSLSELQPGIYPRSDEDLKPLLVQLAENCFQAGIPEEETARWAIAHLYRQKKEFLIRQTVQSVYTIAKGFGKKSPLSAEQELELRTEEFMQRRYEFRYNTMTTVTEYRERNTFCFYFRPLSSRVRNSIAMNARLEGLSLWDRDVVRYLDSDRIPIFNPIEDFLFGLDVRWDGHDRIRELAARVPCNNRHWADLFYRWFLNMVAHWRQTDRKYANCTVPLLVGPQAYRKSTFCRSLLPPELQAYYTDRIDFSNKRDAEISLNRFALINMDEFDQNRVNQQAFLKHILQKPIVNVRRPHGTATQEMRRYASFIGTSNHKDLLTDTSGSRRYIVVDVTGPIDCSPIDYEQLYAQAMHDLYKGERYWFDPEDEKVMNESNQEFQVMPIAEQLFHEYFRAATEGEECEQFLAIEILEQVQHDSKIRVSDCNIIQFGRILQKNRVPSVHTKRGNVYRVVRIKAKRE